MKDEHCRPDTRHFHKSWPLEKVVLFSRYVAALEAFVLKNGWHHLYRCYVSEWCSFKVQPNQAAFGIDGRRNDLKLYVKLSVDEAVRFAIPFVPDEDNGQVLYDFPAGKAGLARFESVLEYAYHKILPA